MGKLTDDEIRSIIKRASIIQKFHEQAPNRHEPFIEDDYETIYEIADSVSINRQFIKEALLEHEGIPIEDPISVDTNNLSDAKILAYANGSVDGGLLNELKAQLEYHFNTVGKVSRRKNMLFWKAKPSGAGKYFDVSTSPELQIEQDKGRVKLTLSQNLRSYNKLFIPVAGVSFGAFMLFAAVIFGASGNDGSPPMLIMSALFFAASFFFTRFINKKKVKKKERLIELMEVLQQTIERRFRTGSKKPSKGRINIPDLNDIEVQEEVTLGEKTKS